MDSPLKPRVGIVGATGYGGAELVRLLIGHPDVQLDYVTSETYAGQPLSNALPHLKGFTDLNVESFDPDRAADGRDLLFLAWQPGRAMETAPALLDRGVRIIDLSADFRLKSPAEFERVYEMTHLAPHLLSDAVYGLPELSGDRLARARLVAVPGCYPTGALLGLAPLLAANWIDPSDVVINAASGVSGAGRSKFELTYHFPEMDENFRPYNPTGHRHRPEIEQQMAAFGGEPKISFVPHLIPMARGILATLFTRPVRGVSPIDLQACFESYYRAMPFAQVLPMGELPATKNVAGTNMAHIAAALDEHAGRILVMTATDNLIRGTSGQAVQAMNRMFGLPETTGLMNPGQYP